MTSIPGVALLGVVACLAAATVIADDEFERVNRLRVQAGLDRLQPDPHLAEAARRHANYLDRHREPGSIAHGVSAHVESAGDSGFSGASPGERAIAAGYAHRQVLENVSMGYADAGSALDGLMSAIYHRFTFLDLFADRLGVAVGEHSRVFELGRSDLDAVCAAPPADALMRSPVDCLGHPMRHEHYDALCAALPDDALFRPPHTTACPDGTRLDGAYMSRICADPPAAARFGGHGRYYVPCDNGRKIAADWFGRACSGRVPGALYAASGSYYELCDAPVRVGAEWLEAYCGGLPDSARYSESMRYRLPCAAAHELKVEYLDALDARRLVGRPELVVWPPDGAADVPPAFFVEDPDPVPDREVTGYPLSLQVNPAYATKVELRRFTLYRVDGDDPVEVPQTRLLDHASDPNHVLSAHQYALFPLQRLDWGARYRAVAELSLDGVTRELEWEFTTRGGDVPLLTVAERSQRFVVDRGVKYLLYLPPNTDTELTALSTQIEHRRGTRVSIDAVDANTLSVVVESPRCDRISLRFNDGRAVTLIPTGCRG
ncbi:MAG: CAP domain-containing protein [Gammaproteobacteria bacterium]|nr:CAP domain-containing protein [Gammaproteobacteria bacterium]